MSQNRELIEESIDIAATPQQVWNVVSDLRRMGERSPQCRKMFILGSRLGRGTRTININSAGRIFWPTTSRIVEFEPERVLSFRIPQNGSVWSYELEPAEQGTRLTESRRLAGGASAISNFLVGKMSGSTADFEQQLQRGMSRTLEQIKTEAEAAS